MPLEAALSQPWLASVVKYPRDTQVSTPRDNPRAHSTRSPQTSQVHTAELAHQHLHRLSPFLSHTLRSPACASRTTSQVNHLHTRQVATQVAFEGKKSKKVGSRNGRWASENGSLTSEMTMEARCQQ